MGACRWRLHAALQSPSRVMRIAEPAARVSWRREGCTASPPFASCSTAQGCCSPAALRDKAAPLLLPVHMQVACDALVAATHALTSYVQESSPDEIYSAFLATWHVERKGWCDKTCRVSATALDTHFDKKYMLQRWH